MQTLLQDLKYAVRMLAKNRGFTIIAVWTLALGIGANTALFSVANGVLLNPLPFSAPRQLVALYEKRVSFERASISYPNFLDWQRDNRSFASMAAFRQDDFNLTGVGEAEHIRGEMVSADFFVTFGVKLTEGRFFTPEDTESSPRVAVIDEDFAGKFFSGEDPIGKVFIDDYVGPATIVGVVGHVKEWGLDDKQAMHAEFYLPFRQIPDRYMSRASRSTTLVLRTEVPPLSLADNIRHEIQQMNSDEVMFMPKTMDDIVYNQSLLAQRFAMILLGAFAMVALFLASVGIYGVVSYIVVQRTHEIGIRVALGAQQSDVMRWVLGAGARMALIGVGIGIAAALALTPLMTNLLYGVSAAGPATFLGVAFLLTLVAIAACYIPARRAMRMDPMAALRQE